MDRSAILDDYIQKMVRVGHPEAIVLFGSEANHTANDESDFDFLVIEQNAGPPRQRAIKYQMALRPRIIPSDILVRTPEELQHAVAEGHPVIREILQKGRWVYGESRTFRTS
ncbi:nucleotidyltransferase domain-containing protein [Sulfobacillus thermosulfidooxidans]|uniref:nucleotidyltransferase domain-containing protein n=1 Tax=Sulfobacillus thermosulfidooxidans TaxID=28034 RepID=UPI00041F03EC|nr:nucleotidyltransferase domain-containing protein [Sulfobacillus thermosulfidooxidans]